MITIKTNGRELPKAQFPRLMTLKEGGGVFFLLNKSEAVCLDNGSSENWKVGEYCCETGFNAFTDYTEPVTIQNA